MPRPAGLPGWPCWHQRPGVPALLTVTACWSAWGRARWTTSLGDSKARRRDELDNSTESDRDCQSQSPWFKLVPWQAAHRGTQTSQAVIQAALRRPQAIQVGTGGTQAAWVPPEWPENLKPEQELETRAVLGFQVPGGPGLPMWRRWRSWWSGRPGQLWLGKGPWLESRRPPRLRLVTARSAPGRPMLLDLNFKLAWVIFASRCRAAPGWQTSATALRQLQLTLQAVLAMPGPVLLPLGN